LPVIISFILPAQPEIAAHDWPGLAGLSRPGLVNSQRKLKLASLSQPGPAKARLGQASFLARAGPGQLWQGQASLGQVRPAQACLGWPEQDIFLHGLKYQTLHVKQPVVTSGLKRNPWYILIYVYCKPFGSFNWLMFTTACS